jgi:threonine dehydrogenase-like Zn-dependent dehydrogenase
VTVAGEPVLRATSIALATSGRTTRASLSAHANSATVADGRIDVQPLVTGKVGLAGVAQAFTSLANPNDQAKIPVEPWRS